MKRIRMWVATFCKVVFWVWCIFFVYQHESMTSAQKNQIRLPVVIGVISLTVFILTFFKPVIFLITILVFVLSPADVLVIRFGAMFLYLISGLLLYLEVYRFLERKQQVI
jgi:hypothetical protein